MISQRLLLCLLLGLSCQPLFLKGEVVSSSENRFQVRHVLTIDAPVSEVYEAMHRDVGKWWNASHTYSADASNMYIELKPHGWFGERLADGGFVQHLEVIHAQTNRLIRFKGGLGPLQGMPVTGVMTWALREVEEGTEVTLVYDVSGESEPTVEVMANPVDGVLGEQMKGLKKFLETER